MRSTCIEHSKTNQSVLEGFTRCEQEVEIARKGFDLMKETKIDRAELGPILEEFEKLKESGLKTVTELQKVDDKIRQNSSKIQAVFKHLNKEQAIKQVQRYCDGAGIPFRDSIEVPSLSKPKHFKPGGRSRSLIFKTPGHKLITPRRRASSPDESKVVPQIDEDIKFELLWCKLNRRLVEREFFSGPGPEAIADQVGSIEGRPPSVGKSESENKAASNTRTIPKLETGLINEDVPVGRQSIGTPQQKSARSIPGFDIMQKDIAALKEKDKIRVQEISQITTILKENENMNRIVAEVDEETRKMHTIVVQLKTDMVACSATLRNFS